MERSEIHTESAIEIKDSLQILITTDGSPSLVYASDNQRDVEIMKGLVSKCQSLDIKDSFVESPTNLSPVDTTIIEVPGEVFFKAFAGLSCVPASDLVRFPAKLPSNSRVWLLLFR